jgi:hypothetical protein
MFLFFGKIPRNPNKQRNQPRVMVSPPAGYSLEGDGWTNHRHAVSPFDKLRVTPLCSLVSSESLDSLES